MNIERKEIIAETKKQLWLVGPMMMVFLFQNLQVITLIFVGHLDEELLLAGASLGISILNVIGYNIMVRILILFSNSFLLVTMREYIQII
jgi:MATE family multidrug resistance protein